MSFDQPFRYYKLDKITTVEELIQHLKNNGEGNIKIEEIKEVPKFHLFTVSKQEIVLPFETEIQIKDGNYLIKMKDKWFIAEDEYYSYVNDDGITIKITSNKVIDYLKSDKKIYIDPLESYLEK